jgi:hypothetical protein
MSELIHLIAELIPAAAAIAVSPLPIVVLVMMLFSKDALKNATAFIMGWLLAMLAIGGIVAFLGAGIDFSASSQPSQVVLVLKMILGGILLVAACRMWSRRPKPGEAAAMPKWMKAFDSSRAFNAFVLGLALMVFNLKNLPIYVSGVGDILQADLASITTLMIVLVFGLVASSGLVVPVAFYVTGGDKAKTGLDSAKAWLLENNAAMLAVLFLIFGLKIVGASLAALLS